MKLVGANDLAEMGVDPEYLTAVMEEAERNEDYFMSEWRTLFADFPSQWLLIHSGDEVEVFQQFLELDDRRRTLDPIVREGAIVRHQTDGTWIL